MQQPVLPSNEPSGLPSAGAFGYVIGVDIGGTNLRLALADMAGSILLRWSVSSTGARDAGAVVALIREGVSQLCTRAGVPRHALRAIAAGAPGITDVENGVVIATSYLMGWRDVPLRTMLEESLGIPASVDNDVNLAARGEGHGGAAHGTSDFVFLAIGTGIGAGIVLGGRSFRGTGWTAGEIGYMLVPGISETPVTRGRPGGLESVAGGKGIESNWRVNQNPDVPETELQLTATQILDQALEHNPCAERVLEKAARAIGYAIYNMSLILNCPLFVLGGGVGAHRALCDAVQTVLDERDARVKPSLVLSALGTEAQLIGAVCLALDTAQEQQETAGL